MRQDPSDSLVMELRGNWIPLQTSQRREKRIRIPLSLKLYQQGFINLNIQRMESQMTSTKYVRSEELLSRFRSKSDLYRYMTQYRLYLPPESQTKVAFLREILNNNKKALQKSSINSYHVPRFAEISVKNLFEDAMNDSELRQHLPELNQNSSKLPDRAFFFDVLSTLRPEYLTKIIRNAQQQRHNGGPDSDSKDKIRVTDEWLNQLLKLPYISKKPGRAIYLLKEGSKNVKERRANKTYKLGLRLFNKRKLEGDVGPEAMMSNKRKKLNDGTMEMVPQRSGTPGKNRGTQN